YVAAARQARDLWREVEEATGRAVLHPAPHLAVGAELAGVHRARGAAGAPCELLPPEVVADRFPALRVDGPALLEPDSAVIAADEALAALGDGLADVRTGTEVITVADVGLLVTVRTAAGPFAARCAVITAGPWSGGVAATAGIGFPARAT